MEQTMKSNCPPLIDDSIKRELKKVIRFITFGSNEEVEGIQEYFDQAAKRVSAGIPQELFSRLSSLAKNELKKRGCKG